MIIYITIYNFDYSYRKYNMYIIYMYIRCNIYTYA